MKHQVVLPTRPIPLAAAAMAACLLGAAALAGACGSTSSRAHPGGGTSPAGQHGSGSPGTATNASSGHPGAPHSGQAGGSSTLPPPPTLVSCPAGQQAVRNICVPWPPTTQAGQQPCSSGYQGPNGQFVCVQSPSTPMTGANGQPCVGTSYVNGKFTCYTSSPPPNSSPTTR